MSNYDFVDGIFAAAGVILTSVLIYAIALGVADAKNEKACLEQGYPLATTTWDFEGYCMNLDGVVTGKVEKLKN